MNWFTRLRLRRALSAAAQSVQPVLQPGQAETEDNGMVASSPGAKVWQYSKARVPLPWGDDISRHNAAIEREAVLERLEIFADALQNQNVVHRRNGLLISQDVWQDIGNHVDEQMAVWVQLYYDCETFRVWAKRINVTGLGPKMAQLTPQEIEDAREASRLTGQIQAKERGAAVRQCWICGTLIRQDESKYNVMCGDWVCVNEPACRARVEGSQSKPFDPTETQEAELEGTILEALGGDEELLKSCGGNLELVAQVKAKARMLFAAGKAKGYDEAMEDS